jgi:hypothetical protein
MKTITRAYILWIISTIALLGAPIVAAQEPADPSPAPIPSQILAAQKVFISNAQNDSIAGAIAPHIAYDEFYAAMRSWGRYELTDTPASADLVFQVGFVGSQAGFPVHQSSTPKPIQRCGRLPSTCRPGPEVQQAAKILTKRWQL